MHHNKHEIYFDRTDYLRILQDFQDEEISEPSEEQTLLIAKAYFIEQFYSECILLLNRLNHNSKAKVLFEKYTLLFKATYLLEPTNITKLTKIIDQFETAKRFITDRPFHNYHLNVFKDFRTFVTTQLPKFIAKSQKVHSSPQQIAKFRQQTYSINVKQSQLQKQHKIQGFPCFLIDKNWRTKSKNFYIDKKNVQKTKDKKNKLIYVQQESSYPCPITNFSIANHIFEIIPYEAKSQQHLNTILFPGQKYEVVSKCHWNYLHELYGGIPLKRVYCANVAVKYSTEVNFEQKMICKLLIQHNNKTEVIQAYSASIWPYSVLPQLQRRYGNGQLKHQHSKNNFKLVGRDKVFEPDNYQTLKYISFPQKNIHSLQPQDIKLQQKIFNTFDFQSYQIQHSPSQGLVGLTNDKLMCYMNSTLQCLSNTYQLSSYFMSNQYVEYLNFSKNNHIGSRGEITCAFADIVKKIWTLYFREKRDAEINPSVFKETFAKRFEIFMEDSQQDAHEFLNFLLNCMHDDLNKNFRTGPNRILKNPKDSSNFEDVRKTFLQNYETYNSSVITDLFKGYTYSTLKCLTCQARYYNFDMHLTIPLPIPATSSSISLFYMNSWTVEGELFRYTVYLDGIQNVEEMGNLVMEARDKNHRRKKGKDEIATRWYLLAVNKNNYKVENYHDSQTKLTKLLNINRKTLFFLYEVSKDNKNPYQISDRKIDIELDSFDDASHNQSVLKTKKLTLIEYVYDDERMGYPKLMEVQIDQPQDRLVATIADTISDQVLNYSGGVATQEEKVQIIDKVKIQKVKGKPYEYTIKVKLEKRINLCRQKQRHQTIGESKMAQFTLENCFNIYREKDKILEEQGWKCAKCKQISDCQREQKIYSVGSHLIIVLKRFKEEQKVCTRIEYPIQNLDITKFIDQKYLKTHPHQKFVYDLYGVIVHRGSLNRGHYYSYCKNQQTTKWYLFDDQLVREQDDITTVVDDNAYILFYKKKYQ